jgi:flagellar biosynthesis anti-sigma factor FlgM
MVDGITGKREPAAINSNAVRQKSPDGAQGKSVFDDHDRVTLSDSRQEFARIRGLVDQVADVRADRVEALTRAINAGAYQVNALDVADAIIAGNSVDLIV